MFNFNGFNKSKKEDQTKPLISTETSKATVANDKTEKNKEKILEEKIQKKMLENAIFDVQIEKTGNYQVVDYKEIKRTYPLSSNDENFIEKITNLAKEKLHDPAYSRKKREQALKELYLTTMVHNPASDELYSAHQTDSIASYHKHKYGDSDKAA